MLIRTQTSRPDERKAVILLVVISLLTLFAIVGLTFVLYANAEANASKIYREASALNQVDMEPEMLFNMFLSQAIYDAPDDSSGVYSAMRGYSLARSMYGFNYDASGTIVNTTPFNGTGRLHTTGGPPPSYGTPFSQPPFNAAPYNMTNPDDWYFVNYTYFRDDAQLKPPNTAFDMTFLRDPERLRGRANLMSFSPIGPYT